MRCFSGQFPLFTPNESLSSPSDFPEPSGDMGLDAQQLFNPSLLPMEDKITLIMLEIFKRLGQNDNE